MNLSEKQKSMLEFAVKYRNGLILVSNEDDYAREDELEAELLWLNDLVEKSTSKQITIGDRPCRLTKYIVLPVALKLVS